MFQEQENDEFKGMCCAEKRRKIWNLMEKPNSSKAAKVPLIYTVLSMQ